tara:strand:+ start:523 stop:765 length:243 start_codon:yes stop_codon:yes gene_type:complete
MRVTHVIIDGRRFVMGVSQNFIVRQWEIITRQREIMRWKWTIIDGQRKIMRVSRSGYHMKPTGGDRLTTVYSFNPLINKD